MKHTTNVYDFDHTIYRGDASFDFIVYCMVRRPRLWRHVPRQAVALLQFILGMRTRTQMKQAVFAFLGDISDIDAAVHSFWKRYAHKLAPWYLAQKDSGDIIISASPEFLLMPLAEELRVRALIGTRMDPATGCISGQNCRGPEKVVRLRQYDAEVNIGKCYSDNLADLPLFKIAQHPFVVDGEKIVPLHRYRASKLQALREPAFMRFLLVGGVNAGCGVLFSYIISFFVPNPTVAFVIGYSVSLVISYFLNAHITFKERRVSVRQFGSFCLSYVPNFAILVSVVFVLANVLNFYPLIAYVVAALVAAPVTFLLLSTFTFTKKGAE